MADASSLAPGDIIVIQPGDHTSQHGHIQIWTGENYISDFNQKNNFWPGSGYRVDKPAFQVYRQGGGGE